MDKCFFGDCRDSMRTMIEQGIKVQTCVTSPPYFGLRDYDHESQLGLEDTPEQYIENMVEVFDLVKEVLADDGTLWLNIGDSYYNYRPGGHERKQTIATGTQDNPVAPAKRNKRYKGIKEKDLIGIPWMLAFALRARGWYLRQDIIWHKPNPMPESVKDRCTKSHEYIFLLTKNKDYYYDYKAISTPLKDTSIIRYLQDTEKQEGSARVPGKKNGNMKAERKGFDKSMAAGGGMMGHSGYFKEDGTPVCGVMANKKSVWSVNTQPYNEAHFAVFPPDLIEPCILAGSRAGDIVFDPFFGSGTTGEVSQRLGRKWIGCELNEKYAPLQKKRTKQLGFKLEVKNDSVS